MEDSQDSTDHRRCNYVFDIYRRIVSRYNKTNPMQKIDHHHHHKRYTYYALCLCRFLLIFTYGYIHPDEFFQSPSVTSSLIFSTTTTTTTTNIIPWEYQQGQRSLLPPLLTSGVPFYLLKLLSIDLNVNWLLFTPRVFLFVLSLVIDHLVEQLSSYQTLVMYSSLWPVLLFHTRTFSNTVESFSLVVLLYCVFRLERFQSVAVGVVCSFGFFTRFTFPFFAWPIVIYHLFSGSRKNSRSTMIHYLVILRKIVDCICGFAIMSAICIWIDSTYYQKLTVTPINNLLYNTKTENLALHTLHPHYLHFAVNMPLLYGPLFLILCIQIVTHRRMIWNSSGIVWCSLISIASGITLLSLAPHQEPRFLLPLSAPLVLLSHHLIKYNKLKWIILYSLFACIFFGYVHQAGVIKTMSKIEPIIENEKSATIVFESTYMPPMYLLLSGHKKQQINIIDHAGSIPNSISCTEFNRIMCGSSDIIYMVTHRVHCFDSPPIQCVFPHLSTEDSNESIQAKMNLCTYKVRCKSR
jgi:phosphatidylinositol glycan class Z